MMTIFLWIEPYLLPNIRQFRFLFEIHFEFKLNSHNIRLCSRMCNRVFKTIKVACQCFWYLSKNTQMWSNGLLFVCDLRVILLFSGVKSWSRASGDPALIGVDFARTDQNRIAKRRTQYTESRFWVVAQRHVMKMVRKLWGQAEDKIGGLCPVVRKMHAETADFTIVKKGKARCFCTYPLDRWVKPTGFFRLSLTAITHIFITRLWATNPKRFFLRSIFLLVLNIINVEQYVYYKLEDSATSSLRLYM
jgi:hypothetical protein